MDKILASVGRGGHNGHKDVTTIQRLINAKLPAHQHLRVDGVCGPLTIRAISDYQRLTLKLATPDGRVDPAGPTFLSLANSNGNGQSVPTAILPAPPPVPAQQGHAPTAMDFFVGQGWTPAQAAGIVANLLAESNLNPAATGDGGQAYGIAQWHSDRQANFRTFAGRAIEGSTVDDQSRFVQYELTNGTENGAGTRLHDATTANDAGSIISQYYERPADRHGEATRRGQRAENILQDYSNRQGTH